MRQNVSGFLEPIPYNGTHTHLPARARLTATAPTLTFTLDPTSNTQRG